MMMKIENNIVMYY